MARDVDRKFELANWMRGRFDRHFIHNRHNPTSFSCAEMERRSTCIRCLTALRDGGHSVFEAERVVLVVADVYARRTPTAVSETGLLLRNGAAEEEWRGELIKACEQIGADPKLLSALAFRLPKKRDQDDDAPTDQPGSRDQPTSEAPRGNGTTDGIGWAVSLPHSSTPR